MAGNVPTPELAIAGARLRAWTVNDAPVLVAAWCDVDVAAWNSVPPEPTVELATRWIEGVPERAARRRSFDWVIDIPDAGIVGEVGLSGFSDRHRGAFIGYWLLPPGRGRGLATQAVAAVTAWAHETLELDAVVARCAIENLPSVAVAERAGYRFERLDAASHQLWVSRTASSS